jgi:hypothetical protein
MSAPLKTFIIYARDDDGYKKELLMHLRPLVSSGLLTVWHDGDIKPGEDWEKTIKKELKSSELVIVLVSVHSLNSAFIQTEELRTALDGLDAGLTRVVPVVVSPCVWKFDPVIRRLQALPQSGPEGVLPVSEWRNNHLAWARVVEQIGDMVLELNAAREQESQHRQMRAQQDAEDRARAEAAQKRIEAEQQAQKAREREEQQRQVQKQQAAAEVAARKAAARAQRVANPPWYQAYAKWLWGAGLLLAVAIGSLFIPPTPEPGNENTAGKVPEKSPAADPAETAWAAISNARSIPVFEKFRRQYPNSKYADAAYNEIVTLEEAVKGLLSDAEHYKKVGLENEAKQKLLSADSIKPNDAKIERMLQLLK